MGQLGCTDDFALLIRWQNGEVDAGDALLARHFWSVFRFFRSKVEDAAEDLTQRTFLACVEARDRVRPELGFKAYLFGIARHELFGYFKRHRRGVQITALGTRSVADLAGTPSAHVVAAQQHQHLLVALRRIPTDFQIAVELYYWEAMSVAEVASVLGVAAGTVKSRLGRARRLLREELQSLSTPIQVDATLAGLDVRAR